MRTRFSGARFDTPADKGLSEAILCLRKGQTLVAYAGKNRRRHESDILYYVGRGVWYTATMADGPDQWTILADADKGKDPSSSDVMFGTFNGEVESLWEMMRDTARGVAYYPAVPLTRFSARTLADFDQPVRGVAMYDVNGDELRLRVPGCGPGNAVRLVLRQGRGARKPGGRPADRRAG